MKTPLTFLLALTFLFVFPSISLSQTFKCEFIQEKFKGGKSNKGICTGKPELKFRHERHEHCKVWKVVRYIDYVDYVVDMNNKTITYKQKNGLPSHRINGMVLSYEQKGDNQSEDEIRKRYSKVQIFKWRMDIVSMQTFPQLVGLFEVGENKETTSHLLTYKRSGLGFKRSDGKVLNDDKVFTLYIPENGESIISEYHITTGSENISWIGMRFGKCVNTSN